MEPYKNKHQFCLNAKNDNTKVAEGMTSCNLDAFCVDLREKTSIKVITRSSGIGDFKPEGRNSKQRKRASMTITQCAAWLGLPAINLKQRILTRPLDHKTS